MKHTYIKKLFFRLTGLCLLMILLIATFFGIKGYQQAIQQTSIEDILPTLQKQDTFTHYEDLPQIYIDAVISVEDKRFETHHGIDLLAISRAAWHDVLARSFIEGGSTITQQIAKNELFTQEKHIERKFAEIFAAFALESQYSKQELFEIYVNTIYFGQGYHGIYEAAQGYFQKTPDQLNDYEAIMLAGIPNAPSIYSIDQQLAQKRMQVVLQRMVNCHKLTEQEAQEILKKRPQYN